MGAADLYLGILAFLCLLVAYWNINSGQIHLEVMDMSSKWTLEAGKMGSSSANEQATSLLPPLRLKNPLPPLDSYLQGEWNITGLPVQPLLDFSIVGFPKCGTSTLMYGLQKHPQIAIFGDERCDLSYNQHAHLIRDLHAIRPNTSNEEQFLRGIKCPMELESTQLGLRNYKTYFNETALIVGLRHPVRWMESFYNFRLHNGYRMPPITTLVGKCYRKSKNVCTFRANFHVFLSNLGLTPRTPEELEYMLPWHRSLDPVPFAKRVFVYEISQLSSEEEPNFLQDLQHFLGLPLPIPSMQHYTPGRANSTTTHHKINICEPDYKVVRDELMKSARNASAWITKYLMHSPAVTVSSPDAFVRIMEEWQRDPCDATT